MDNNNITSSLPNKENMIIKRISVNISEHSRRSWLLELEILFIQTHCSLSFILQIVMKNNHAENNQLTFTNYGSTVKINKIVKMKFQAPAASVLRASRSDEDVANLCDT